MRVEHHGNYDTEVTAMASTSIKPDMIPKSVAVVTAKAAYDSLMERYRYFRTHPAELAAFEARKAETAKRYGIPYERH